MDDLARRLREAADKGADMRAVLWFFDAVFITVASSAILLTLRATYHLLFVADWSNLP